MWVENRLFPARPFQKFLPLAAWPLEALAGLWRLLETLLKACGSCGGSEAWTQQPQGLPVSPLLPASFPADGISACFVLWYVSPGLISKPSTFAVDRRKHLSSPPLLLCPLFVQFSSFSCTSFFVIFSHSVKLERSCAIGGIARLNSHMSTTHTLRVAAPQGCHSYMFVYRTLPFHEFTLPFRPQAEGRCSAKIKAVKKRPTCASCCSLSNRCRHQMRHSGLRIIVIAVLEGDVAS